MSGWLFSYSQVTIICKELLLSLMQFSSMSSASLVLIPFSLMSCLTLLTMTHSKVMKPLVAKKLMFSSASSQFRRMLWNVIEIRQRAPWEEKIIVKKFMIWKLTDTVTNQPRNKNKAHVTDDSDDDKNVDCKNKENSCKEMRNFIIQIVCLPEYSDMSFFPVDFLIYLLISCWK